jgi:hypothetical protein
MARRFGCSRVSTSDQDWSLQLGALTKAGVATAAGLEPATFGFEARCSMGFLPESGGVRSEYQAASRIVTASMLARASAGVR